ncbi:MAG: SpoIVB peptidase [Blautia sp.]|jgi:stage IV sporulation protein B
MKYKKKYRRFLFFALALDLLVMGYLGYRMLDQAIPEELQVVRGEEDKLTSLLDSPWVTWSDAVTTSQNGVYRMECKILGVIPFRQVKVTQVDREEVYTGGIPVGIYMETQGVLVIDTGEIVCQDGTCLEPAKNIAKAGDYIVAFNEKRVRDKKDLIEEIRSCQGKASILSVIRHGEEISLELEPVVGDDGNYKLGIWVRDNTQGIGTLTYMDKLGNYGALGHGISDVDTGDLMQIKDGTLYQAQILAVQKGVKGSPGELSGMIRYEDSLKLGKISKNCENGIYGLFEGNRSLLGKKMDIGYKQEMKVGKASILCCVDDEVKEYEAQITNIDMNHQDTNKSFVIQVTDKELLSKTGGIVQGMSGSPVLQDGRLVGAVTHVFVNDPTKGYGIFAETMLEQ